MFDQGDFSEDETFLVTDWLSHVPKEVIARNFKVDQEALASIPSRQLWIFPGNNSESLEADLAIVAAAGEVPEPMSYAFNQSEVVRVPGGGGTVRIVDSTKFTVAKAISMADVTIEPGAIRELHVSHPSHPRLCKIIDAYVFRSGTRLSLSGASSWPETRALLRTPPRVMRALSITALVMSHTSLLRSVTSEWWKIVDAA